MTQPQSGGSETQGDLDTAPRQPAEYNDILRHFQRRSILLNKFPLPMTQLIDSD